MKKVKLAIASVLSAAVMLPVLAQAEVAYNIGVVPLYKSNGVDQNTGEAKDWNSSGKLGAANREIDLMAGTSTNSTRLCYLPVACSGKLIAPDRYF